MISTALAVLFYEKCKNNQKKVAEKFGGIKYLLYLCTRNSEMIAFIEQMVS